MGLIIGKGNNVEKMFVIERQTETSDNNGIDVSFKLSSDNREAFFDFPFTLPLLPSENTSTVYFFKNNYFKTNDVIEFRIEKGKALMHNGNDSKNGSVGYLFSNQTFLEQSGADIFSRAKFSILYAFTAIELILKNGKDISLKPKKIQKDADFANLTMSSLYDNDVIFLVIDKSLLRDSDSFNIENYLCDLYKLGFYFLTEHNSEINYNKLSTIRNNFASVRKQYIKVKSSSSAINFQEPNSFYKTLIQKIIIQKSEFPTSFIALFQVIELLKDDVLKNEMKKIRTIDTQKTGYEVRKKVNQLSTDALLIKKLFTNSYSNLEEENSHQLIGFLKTFFEKTDLEELEEINEDIKSLINELRFFLVQHFAYRNKARKKLYSALENKVDEFENHLKNKRNQENFASLLYKFRNTLLHNYSGVIQSEIENSLFLDIQMCFEYLIIDLILTFKSEGTEL